MRGQPNKDDARYSCINNAGRIALSEFPKETSWEWARDHIDYGRASNYDTPYKGKFDPDIMPFWKEPLEMARDRNVRELVVMKCSRAGYSEGLLLTDLRYTIARAPEPTLYISGVMDLTLGFFDRRVLRGMNLSKETVDKLKFARVVKQDIQFLDMDFRATWASSDTATKQDGWARIHCDEVSLWGEFTVDMVRRRAAAYPFHHIIFGGSIDPTRRGNPDDDPVLKMYDESDKRIWVMTDTNGKPFVFQFAGIKWPEYAKDGDDYRFDVIENEAWYETPSGARIEEADRMAVVRGGHWMATNKDKAIRAGYKVTSPMVPFADCSFGVLAIKFLSAKMRINQIAKKEDKKRNSLRTYFAENWAEVHREEQITVSENALADREQDYEAGTVFVDKEGATYGVALTVDVQKFHLWYVARAWSMSGESVSSSLVEWGTLPSFAALHDKTAEINPSVMGIDIGYALRASEVGDFCAEHSDQANIRDARIFALRGNDQQTKNIIDQQVRDALEGRAANGQRLFVELMWQTDVFRTWLIEMMAGLGKVPWYVCKGLQDTREGQEYIRQVTSTRKVDGIWIPPKHGQDHLFDCEAMQLVLSRFDGLI